MGKKCLQLKPLCFSDQMDQLTNTFLAIQMRPTV